GPPELRATITSIESMKTAPVAESRSMASTRRATVAVMGPTLAEGWPGRRLLSGDWAERGGLKGGMQDDRPVDPLTLAGFQQHIRDRYFATDSARGTPATWMWFSEEVGELARALARDTGEENVAEEFADVLAGLCTLANINGVERESAERKSTRLN